MKLDKYSKLRNKIKNKDFERKNSSIDKWLNIFSYIGNIGSIFFAFFLIYPAFLKAITANLISGNIAIYLGGFITILLLAIFELLKRKVLSNLSFDIIKNKFKINISLISSLIGSLCLIGASFYFSLNGAIKFANTSDEKNLIIEMNIQDKIDSLTIIYENKKQPFIIDNADLRKSNKELRNKISNTPLNYRTVRKELQNLIDANMNNIKINDKKILAINSEFEIEKNKLEENKEVNKKNNKSEDFDNILLFLMISTSIEFIIILGVYFREFFEYNVYLLNESKLEGLYKKRNRYLTLLKFIYKKGSINQDEKIIAVSKLKQLIKEKGNIESSNRIIDEFFNDMTYLNIFKTSGKRRYAIVNYEEAIKKVQNFDDSLKLLEELK